MVILPNLLKNIMKPLTTIKTYVKINDLVKAQAFYRNLLGMSIDLTASCPDHCLLAIYNEFNHIVLSEVPHAEQCNNICLTTADCLEDYCRLKLAGVTFTSEPQYCKKGLSAQFDDLDGNHYQLLEARKYEL